MTIRIGTSGWVYKDWRGIFYPQTLRQSDWFSYFARQFDTVEINNTFYRLPDESTFKKWRAQAPEGFVYAVKASRYLTHVRRLNQPEEPLQTFFDRASGLGATLGPVLYQLPPHWKVDLPRLEYFLRALPSGYVHVLEFRDPSWLNEAVFNLMEHFGVAHCIHDLPPLEIPFRVTASTVYVRLHGGTSHREDYPRAALKNWAGRLQQWDAQALDAYVYFNNDWDGAAIRNARALRKLCGIPELQGAG